jgi:allantoinase
VTYPRDLVGYGEHPPHAAWPNRARVAVQIVMNYEEGSEYSIPDGDGISETYLTEVPGATLGPGKRDLIVESIYEYGSRAGFWRLMRMFAEREIHVTCFGAALALERNPAAARAIAAAGHEVCSHGYRWVGFQDMAIEEERAQMKLAVASIEKTIGTRPLGWYCRYAPSLNTRKLVVEEGGFLYDSDAYDDDLPYWTRVERHEVLGRPGVHVAGRFLPLPQGCVRRALRRGEDDAEDDVGRPAYASRGSPRACGGAGTIPR